MSDNNRPISVTDDITPITKQPIDRVDPTKWETMSLTQLHEQRYILSRRQQMALQVGMVSAAQQIERGIVAITEIINRKGSSDSMEFL